MMPGGNLRWQIRARPTAGHREYTPKMATPLDSTSMMKLVEVHAELNVFPGCLAASGRHFEPQRGLCSRRGACGTTTSDKDSVDFEILRTSDHTGLILKLAWRLVTKQWFRRAGYGLR
jgi:hypothetical protein